MININKIARCFRAANNSIVKVKRFNFMYQRLNIYLIGGALLAAYLIANLSDESYKDDRNKVFNYKQRIENQFESLSLRMKERGDDPGTLEQFYKQQLPKYYDEFLLIIIFSIITLTPWIIFVIWRQTAPICIERKRQLIYTWHKGKLYAAKLEQLQVELKDKSTHLEFSGGWGPMIISLYPAGKVYNKLGNLNKGKRIPIGTFIPQYNYQNHDLKPFIDNYMAGYINIPDGIELSKSWLEYVPRKPKELPNDDILNKAINEWLAKDSKQHI